MGGCLSVRPTQSSLLCSAQEDCHGLTGSHGNDPHEIKRKDVTLQVLESGRGWEETGDGSRHLIVVVHGGKCDVVVFVSKLPTGCGQRRNGLTADQRVPICGKRPQAGGWLLRGVDRNRSKKLQGLSTRAEPPIREKRRHP